MKNTPKIYDIDGDVIYEGKNLTIDEAQERIQKYQKKLNELSEKDPKDPKLSIYNTYIKNLQSYIFNQYILHPELMPHIEYTSEDAIQKAMEELKADVENDEYTEFEEIKNDEETV